MPCKPENKSYLDSYEVETDKVKQANPSLSEHDIKVQVAQRFRPKFHEWREAGKVENSGKPEYQNGEFTMDSQGKMFFPKSGEYAEQMSENQRLLSELHNNPAEYSLADHQLSLLIQSTLAGGATRVVTSFGNRDILEYRYDPINNKGSIHVIDTTKVARAYNDVRSIALEKFSRLSKAEPTKGMFVLSDKSISERVAKETIRTIHYAGKQTIQEVRQTFSSVRRYIEEKKELGVQKKKQEQNIFLVPEQQKQTLFETLKESVLSMRKPKQKNTSMEIKTQSVKQKELIERSPVFSMAFASEIRLKIAPVLPEMNKSIRRHERKMKKTEMKLEVKQKTFIPKEIFLKIQKEKKSKIFLAEKFGLKKRTIRKEVIGMKLKKEKIKTERVMKERVVRLITLVRKFIQRKEKIVGLKIQTVEKKKIQEQVLDISIAVLLWFLLAKPKNVLTNEYILMNKENKKLIVKEQTPWLLLSIIWQLAMIRESGMPAIQPKIKQKKVKKTTFSPLFEPRGVIFAYAT